MCTCTTTTPGEIWTHHECISFLKPAPLHAPCLEAKWGSNDLDWTLACLHKKAASGPHSQAANWWKHSVYSCKDVWLKVFKRAAPRRAGNPLNMAEKPMLKSVQSLLGSIRLASGGKLHLATDGISAPPEQSIVQNSKRKDAEAGPSALSGFEAKRNHSRRNDYLNVVVFCSPINTQVFLLFKSLPTSSVFDYHRWWLQHVLKNTPMFSPNHLSFNKRHGSCWCFCRTFNF